MGIYYDNPLDGGVYCYDDLPKHSFTNDYISTHRLSQIFLLIIPLGILACIEFVIISLEPSTNIKRRLF